MKEFLNPFQKEEKKRFSDTGRMVGEILTPEHEAAYREATGEGRLEEAETVEVEEEQTDTSEIDADLEISDPSLVTLRNIPNVTHLPDAQTLKRDFRLASVYSYIPNRDVSDFAFTEMSADIIGLTSQLRISVLESLHAEQEAIRKVKVFDISHIIEQKRKNDSGHPPNLTTEEVLEAMDAAGYRPATLLELFAFSRDYWKPGADSGFLTDEERQVQHLDTKFLFALGSEIKDYKTPSFAYLWHHDGDRMVYLKSITDAWPAMYRFLAVRK